MSKRVRASSGSLPARKIAKGAATVFRKRALSTAGRLASRAIPVVGQAMAAYDVGKAAYDVGKDIYNRFQKTPRGKGTIKKDGISYPVRGTYAGRMPRKARKVKNPRIEKQGVSFNLEVSKVLTDKQALYVGHTTHPTRYLRRVFIAALVKQLFRKVGVLIKDMTDTVINMNGDNNDSFRIAIYGLQGDVKIGTQGGVGSVIADYSATGTANMMTSWVLQLDDKLVDYFNGIPNVASNWNNFVMTHATITVTPQSSGQPIRTGTIMLQDSKVELHISSYLAIQNRSVSAAGSTSTDTVDTTPLQGRMYTGSGNGVELIRNPRNVTFGTGTPNAQGICTGDDKYGLMALYPNGMSITSTATVPNVNQAVSFNDYSSPPPGWAFKHVKKVSKTIHMEPGSIKTSYLKENKIVSVQYLLKQLYIFVFSNSNVSVTAATDMYNQKLSDPISTLSKSVYTSNMVRRSMGQFKLYGFEKIIDIGGTESQNISLGIEANLVIGAKIKESVKTYTSRLFFEEDI